MVALLRPHGVALRFEGDRAAFDGRADGCLAWLDAATAPAVWSTLRGPGPVVVIAPELAQAVELARRGARGCVTREEAPAWLPLAMSVAPLGLFVWSPAVARRLQQVLDARADEGDGSVRATEREIETLSLFARGLSYDQAARALGVSANTVRSHVRAVYAKLEVATKTEAVLAARRRGWLTDERRS